MPSLLNSAIIAIVAIVGRDAVPCGVCSWGRIPISQSPHRSLSVGSVAIAEFHSDLGVKGVEYQSSYFIGRRYQILMTLFGSNSRMIN